MEAEVGQLEAMERVGSRVSREANCCLIQSAYRTQLITKQRLWFQLKKAIYILVSGWDTDPREREGGLEKCRHKTNASANKICWIRNRLIQRENIYFGLFLDGSSLPWFWNCGDFPARHWDSSPCFLHFFFLRCRSWTEYTAHDARRTTLASVQLSVKFYSTEEKPVERASITG